MCKASKSHWPWLWPFKITQGQMWWCHWTLHTWFTWHICWYIYIYLYSSHMSIPHRLALIATRNVFSYLLSLCPNYENRKCTGWPLNDLECCKGKGTPYMNYCLRVPNFTRFQSLVFQTVGVLGCLHRVQWWIWNFRKKVAKNRTLKISKIFADLQTYGWYSYSFLVWLKS